MFCVSILEVNSKFQVLPARAVVGSFQQYILHKWSLFLLLLHTFTFNSNILHFPDWTLFSGKIMSSFTFNANIIFYQNTENKNPKAIEVEQEFKI